MPGIVGLVSRMRPAQAEQELLQMIATMQHEKFYVAGTWADHSLGVYVAWTARRGSFSEEMPLHSERCDVTLVFSGEDFPVPGITRRLKDLGHQFNSDGASYLVHVYEEDRTFPAGLNGRFHGLLVDRNLGTATLFNDRYAMHRLYYYESKEAFYFAAEAKAILAVRPELRKIDPQGLGEFVACGCVLDDRSLFKDVRILPGASRWVCSNGSLLKKERYFQPREWESQDQLQKAAYYRELREAFCNALPRYFEGGEQLGMSLTGGLDTRIIMAWQRSEPKSLPCYSFGGMLRDCEDVILAGRVARSCEQPYQVICAGERFLSQFSHYAERAVYLADGCVDVSRAPDLYLNERAREIAPVRLTGLFGGELFRGVVAFKAGKPSSELFASEVSAQSREAMAKYADFRRQHPVSFAAFKQAPWHHYGGLALEETQVSMRSPYLDNDLVRTAYRAPAAALRGNGVSLRLIEDGNDALLRIRTDRGLGKEQERFLGLVLQGLRQLQFKAEYLYDIGMPQWVARIDHAFSGLRIDRLFLGRHKIFHFRVWYRDTLAAYVREMLLDPRTLSRPFLKRKGVEAIVRGHLKRGGNYTGEIHKVLTLELVHRLFLDSGSFSLRRTDGFRGGLPTVSTVSKRSLSSR